MKLTLIFGFKNREITRVKRCLDSLANQSTKAFKVIFVDYGSDEDVSESIEQLINAYDFCRYVFNHTRGQVWNRSHALNTGIRLADTEYVMTTDIDLIYAVDFVEEVLCRLSERTELHANAYALPENFKNWDTLQTSPPNLKSRDFTALGLAQGLLTQHLMEVNGFDEYYRIWGVEDYDLQIRLEQLEIETKWLNLEEVPIYHQWHPPSAKRTRTGIPRGWQKHMSLYCDRMISQTRRNTEEWGKILTAADRPAYQAIAKNTLVESDNLIGVPFLGIQEKLDEFLAASGNLVKTFIFEDDNYLNFQHSRLTKLISRINGWSDRLDLPVLLSNDAQYFGMASSVNDYWDVVMFWLLRNRHLIIDYHMHRSERRLVLTIAK